MSVKAGLLLSLAIMLVGSGCAPTRQPGRLGEGAMATVNGTTLAYEVAGRGPAVVLIHGGGLDRRLWDGQIGELARHFRVIRYDVRGAGRSGRSDTAPFQHHEDLAALLHFLGVQQASLVGQSLGGRIALDLALTHPDLVDRIVAVGPGVSGWPWASADFGPWLTAFRAALIARDTAAAAAAWLASGYMASAGERPELRKLLRGYAQDNARMWFEDDKELELAPPATSRFATISVPVLLIVGSRDEAVIVRISDTLLAQLPNVRREWIDGAGHVPNLEYPDRFNQLLLEYLSQPRHLLERRKN